MARRGLRDSAIQDELQLVHPKAVQVAVLVNGDRGIALGDGEHGFRSCVVGKRGNLEALLGDEADELDVVLGSHRVLDAADANLHHVALNLDGGNVLFNGCIDGTGNQLRHGLATANHGHAGINELDDDVSASVATIEFDLHASLFSLTWLVITGLSLPYHFIR